MCASASRDNGVLPRRVDPPTPSLGGGVRQVVVEAGLTAVAYVGLCIVVLSVAPQVAEPDDGAYHHSIVAIAAGEFRPLSQAQLTAVDAQLGGPVGQVPSQWIELGDGRFISEKNPGYPFLAAPFQVLGVVRWAPLFYGALGCLGLFLGARRWLGRFGGLAAVGLYCSSGAAMAFAWRDYMPTFTDASLVAAGSGTLLWALLAEAGPRRRTLAGLAGFLALEIATFVRYTDLVILGCAVMAAIVARRLRPERLPLRTLGWWLASVAVLGAGVAAFDDLVYGGPLTTGYRPGEVTFGLGAVGPNLRIMPAHLLQAMPALVFGLVALVWIVVRWLALRRVDGQLGAVARRDLGVGVVLAASWMAVWGLYLAYRWTADDPSMVTLPAVRFYVPAIGAISLLGSWLVTRLPGRAWRAVLTSVVVTAMFGVGVWSFYAMYAAFGVPLGG